MHRSVPLAAAVTLLVVACSPEGLGDEQASTEARLSVSRLPAPSLVQPYITCFSGTGGGGFTGPGPWFVSERNECMIMSEVGAKLSAGFYSGTQQQADALVACILAKLKEVKNPDGRPCYDPTVGFPPTPLCLQALTTAERECGGPSVTLTEL